MDQDVRSLVDSTMLHKKSEFGREQRDFIQAGIDRQLGILSTSTKQSALLRAQGALMALREVLAFEDNLIKTFQEGISNA